MNADPSPELAVHVPAEIRSRLARNGVTMSAFAETIDRTPQWVLRRLSPKGDTGVTLSDLQVIADGLGVDPRDLLP